ncbi:hypothetical protein KHA90_02690 [Flavobacterium psychroterrae]|uniref:Uncharacterized protein n=1 Tax=Flavobacterium psychroterrae TaxID=2133767 RepID=A0ABS5P6I7_9FLAO|nr:hypothetical protein [Flavobacterium psychroterrae]MBS7229920.1 hypothetical protein [Flavobacterium psychroterrae]
MKNKYIITIAFALIVGLIGLFFYSSDIKQKKDASEYVPKNGDSVFDDKLLLSNHQENKLLEEKIDNFPSGKIMRYTSYDDLGVQAYTILFDENENVVNFKGYPLIETYQNNISKKRRLKQEVNQYLKVGDTLKYHYLIANVPNAKRIFKIENENNKKAKRTLKNTSQIGIDVKEVLVKKGINTIEAVLTYEFTDKEKTSVTYTEIFEVIVN